MNYFKKIKTKVGFLAALFLLMGCGNSSTSNQETQKKEKQPNVFIVISDDQSWLHTGITGDPQIQTPYFDQIATEGVLFNNYPKSHTASLLCRRLFFT